jgi:hypothetical protein
MASAASSSRTSAGKVSLRGFKAPGKTSDLESRNSHGLVAADWGGPPV